MLYLAFNVIKDYCITVKCCFFSGRQLDLVQNLDFELHVLIEIDRTFCCLLYDG